MSERPAIFKTEEIYKGRIFRVRIDAIEDHGVKRKLEIVEHPGSFAIAPVPAPGRVVLVRQYRHAAGQALWEIPAGTAEAGEAHEAGARRELREETGYTADSLELLCSVYPTPGYCTERVHLYTACGLHAGPQALEEDEHIEIREFSLQEAWKMQASGQIIDMKTVLALLWLTNGCK
jgi:ADP-ribose pyrophosphatase